MPLRGMSLRGIASRWCSVMASLLTQGMISAAPMARCGHTAPNSQAESRRSSRIQDGRGPTSAQTAPYVPCWPTLASSWNQTSSGLPTASASRVSATRPAKFFKSLLGLKVPLGVVRPRLQAQLAQEG